MPDIAIGLTGWGADLAQTPSGDLQTVDGSALGTQRVTRRLLTPPHALVFHPDYGFGLPQRIGETFDRRAVIGQMQSQMFKEAAVAQSPLPQITLGETSQGSGAVYSAIRYQDQNSGVPQLLEFDLTA